MMDEREFQKQSDATLEALRNRLLDVGDENNFEVEGGSGKLEIEFEDEDETRFVISPNAPVRQIWISALTTSFKLAWSDAAQAFVQAGKRSIFDEAKFGGSSVAATFPPGPQQGL